MAQPYNLSLNGILSKGKEFLNNFTGTRGINHDYPGKPGHVATLQIRGLVLRPILCSSGVPRRMAVEQPSAPPALTAARSWSRLEEAG